ncbi:cell division protein ZipA [Volucribacter amazonae]|uniref:Cell division protein ZipA n=1 Tax=Volucribacter amazonae TaxID=256731 RepID=A0A9X4P8S9_9PAST|nr:cell division protein ZipA [Volucribacter amazonae]MDG6894755.1 hypothetical protein [Volucribacter amazonae]
MDLNTILIILGILALVILIAHGLWSSRREKTHFFKNANTFTRDGRIEQVNTNVTDKQTDPLTGLPIQQAGQLHGQQQPLTAQIEQPSLSQISQQTQPIQQGLDFEAYDVTADKVSVEPLSASATDNSAEVSLEQAVNEIKITLPNQSQAEKAEPVYYDMSSSSRANTAHQSTYSSPSTSYQYHQPTPTNTQQADLAYRSIADIEASLGEEGVNLSSQVLREQLATASLQGRSGANSATAQTTLNHSYDEPQPLVDTQQNQQSQSTKATSNHQAQDFIVLYVVAPENREFNGTHLAQALEELGFVYSDEGIFNRHLDTMASPVLYSVANIHQPGTFDLNTMADFSTIGVAIFMQLTGNANDRVNFIYLCQDAKNLADKLAGYVLDEQQELFTEQTKASYLARLN